jgi:Domain of unknown function DUF11
MKELAGRSCGARLFVRKRMAGSAADQPDWGFGATSNGGAVAYLDGNRRTHATTGNSVETGVILTRLPAGGREVTVTEDAAGQPLEDFELDSVACRTGGYDGAPVAPLATPALGVTLAVQPGSTIYCTFTNSPAKVDEPAIDIEKTGPATAQVGAPITYTLTVTNPGNVPFARQDVIVADPRCEAPPAGPDTGGDASPDRLDPGDSWTYTCTAQTAGRPAGTFVNTATVTAKDFSGRAVTDTDDFPTMLETREVLTQQRNVAGGRAKLRGPSGCVNGRFTATVRGRRIARVTFFRDGKKVKTIMARPGQRKFTVRLEPSGRPGVHRVTARVVFTGASQTRARTLRLSYQRCGNQVVRPRFTG